MIKIISVFLTLVIMLPMNGIVSSPDPNQAEKEAKNDYAKAYYEPLIAEWRSCLIKHNNGEHTEDDTFNFYFYSGTDLDSVEAHYSLYDIDGNGIQELILKKEYSYEAIIAYIFIIKDNTPINLFGYDKNGIPLEVSWSRVGASEILSNGLIDSTDGDYAIYKIADDGYTLLKIAYSEPYNYPDEASLALADWRYYINGIEVEYDVYVQKLSEQGYVVGGNNALAAIDWIKVE